MDPISIPLLVTGTWAVLEPFVKKAGGKLLEKAGEILPEAVGKVWEMIKAKMESKPETASLPADLANKPESSAVHGAFQYQLEKLLENDEAFAQELDALVKEARKVDVTSMSATLTGSGAIAQGENAKAVGAGGVMVGGSVTGNINTGSNSSVDDDDEKKKKK